MFFLVGVVRTSASLTEVKKPEHEVIVVPESAGMDPKSLEAMVKDANRTVVAPKDVLSDNVYYFDRNDMWCLILFRYQSTGRIR